MSEYKYTLRWADGSNPSFFCELSEIPAKFDLHGFGEAEVKYWSDTDPSEIDIELKDEDGNVVGWILPA